MKTTERNAYELEAGLYGLLAEAISRDVERRSQQREPFMAPVAIQRGAGKGGCLTGFTRDISVEGIGLIHAFPLEREEIVVKVFGADEKTTLLYVKIEWCDPIGEGWYISGGRFIYRLS